MHFFAISFWLPTLFGACCLCPVLSLTVSTVILCYVSLYRKVLNWCRSKSAIKNETEENLYTRWEQDNDLMDLPRLGLFEEYLEMGEGAGEY